jgi:hypothetical protein
LLDSAMRLRHPGVSYLTTDSFMGPRCNEPHFKSVMREEA